MNPILAVITLSLETLTNDELTATNNAVKWQGRVPPHNLAFNKLKKLNLIQADGSLFDSEIMKDACAIVVNDRVEAGGFV